MIKKKRRVVPKKRQLTLKQKRFIEEFLVDLNATQAAIRAGYSKKTAYAIGDQILKKPHIAAIIKKATDKLSKDTKVTQEMVINGLLKEATRVGDGASHSARVQAWGYLGKHFGAFIDRRLLGIRNVDDMTEDELLAFLGGEPESEELRKAASVEKTGDT